MASLPPAYISRRIEINFEDGQRHSQTLSGRVNQIGPARTLSPDVWLALNDIMDPYLDHEFTTAEIFEAFRPFMTEAEARHAADFLTEPVDLDAIRAEAPQNEGGPGLSYWTIPTTNFSPDTLILLSLVSEVTAAKVDRYRSRMREAGAISPEDEETWQRRRKEFAAWRDKGFPQNQDDTGPSSAH